MEFYACLIGLNILCFLPFYFINFREHPNPFEFIVANWRSPWKLFKNCYIKFPLSDPFRVHADYSLLVLIAAALSSSSNWVALFAAIVWTLGFLDFTYSSIMQIIFRRRPSLRSDLRFAKTGLTVIHHHRVLAVLGIVVAVLGLLAGSYVASDYLLRHPPENSGVNLVLAGAILVPALFRWRVMTYPYFLFRTVYSPTLNIYRNYLYSQTYASVRALDRAYFESLNGFRAVVLREKPDFISVCVESYGSFAFLDEETFSEIEGVLESYSRKLAAEGLHTASIYSEPPLFAGGSWLSYTSFTYGLRIDDYSLHDALFTGNNAFPAYESLFHVLKRNNYHSFLLCPLGGYEAAAVNWDGINRCFQSDRNYDFDSLRFDGGTYPFLFLPKACFPPDQYSLNFAYEDIRRAGDQPFSLFFCTLNSHYPWDSPAQPADDWRAPDDTDYGPAQPREKESDLVGKYRVAIRYQLDYLLRFALEHGSENLVITLFGDHQAPFITPETLGKRTPVHVISRSAVLTEELCKQGFVPGLDLSEQAGGGIKHAGFLSIFMRAVNRAFGEDPELRIDLRPDGVDLLGSASDKHDRKR